VKKFVRVDNKTKLVHMIATLIVLLFVVSMSLVACVGKTGGEEIPNLPNIPPVVPTNVFVDSKASSLTSYAIPNLKWDSNTDMDSRVSCRWYKF